MNPVRVYNRSDIFPSKNISSCLPLEVVITRITLLAFASIAMYFASIWTLCPLICYTGYLLYTQFMKKDDLVGRMYALAGGQEVYIKLPELERGDRFFWHFARDLDWDKLDHPLYRITIRGKKGLVVKAESILEGSSLFGQCRKQTIFVLVERLSPVDFCAFVKQVLSFRTGNQNAFMLNAHDSIIDAKPVSRNVFLAGRLPSLA